MSQPKKLAVFASGNGSNFEALKGAEIAQKFNGKIELLICDQPKAKVIDKAKSLGVQYEVIEKTKEMSKKEHESMIYEKVRGFDGVLLAGYMRLLSSEFIQQFYDEQLGASKIINIHPSLLPAFPGLDAYEQAFKAGVKITGCTVHFVDEGCDSGPIIFQKSFEINPSWALSDLKSHGLKMEHEAYPEAINHFCQDRLVVKDHRVEWIHE